MVKWKLIFIFLLSAPLLAQNTNTDNIGDVGIDEQLGAFLPAEAWLRNDRGDSLQIRDFLGKPLVLSFVYYRCPNLCSNILSGQAEVMDRADVVPGIDYNALTISINADETWRDAQAEKANYLQLFQRRSIDPNSWQYCVADSATIAKLTGISGFLFQRVGVEFAHTGALIIVSPKGKIVRYLYGTEHLKFDFKMALNEALAERPGATITKVLEYCFSYDPAGRTYVFNFTRVAGTIVLILLFLFVLVFLVRRRRNPQSQMQR
jgi:protein SCO1/2